MEPEKSATADGDTPASKESVEPRLNLHQNESWRFSSGTGEPESGANWWNGLPGQPEPLVLSGPCSGVNRKPVSSGLCCNRTRCPGSTGYPGHRPPRSTGCPGPPCTEFMVFTVTVWSWPPATTGCW